jgi:hypothetical protein
MIALAQLVEDRRPLLTSAPGWSRRQVSAAYLARCRRFLLGMHELLDAGMPDLIGSLVRPMFEAWLYGLWIILGDTDALDRVISAYKRDIEKLDRMAGLELDQEMDGWAEEPQGPRVEEIARHVGQLLVQAGDPGGAQLLWSYQLVYRSESSFGVHGGLASVMGHLNDDDEPTPVSEARDTGDGRGSAVWCGILLAVLARHVWTTFGVGVDLLDDVAGSLAEGLI